MQRGHCDVQERHDPVKGRLCWELHIALQQIHLRKGDGNDLVTRAFQHQVALFYEIKRELEVQVGALAQGFEMRTEFSKGCVIHFAIERDVVLYLRTAMYPVKDIGLEILIDSFVLFQPVQEYPMEGQ